MTNIVIIENKISSIKKYIKIVKGYQTYTLNQIERDVNIRGMVERYLYLMVQSTIDLAEAFVSYKKLRKPTTMSEAFHILEEEKIIDVQLMEKMIAMTGFRNIIAHDYEKIDYSIVYDVLQNGVKDIDIFIKKINKVQ